MPKSNLTAIRSALPLTPQVTPPPTPQSAPEQRSKTRLLEHVKRCGPLTAQEVAQKLEISLPAARRHLGDLLEQGLLEARTERPSGRGRPQSVFALTELGEATFPKTYSDLCLDVLRHIEQLFGEGAVLQVLDSRNAELAQRLEHSIPRHLPAPQRRELLMHRLNELGFDAVLEQEGDTLYLVQRNCPNLAVARQFRALCASEHQLYELVLGHDVVRDKTIACGQGVCRYRLALDEG